MKGSRIIHGRNIMPILNIGFVGMSKTCRYESPYTVTGSIKQIGLKELPKSICKDTIIGTW